MDKETIEGLIITIISLMIIIISTFLALTYYVPDDYKLNLDCSNCSIGKPEIAGDYTLNPINKNPLNFYDSKSCAIKDCVAFNTYRELNKSNLRCVV